jgi:L-asparaginase II
MATKQPLVVEVMRGPVVESLHQVMAVTVRDNGAVFDYAGNPQFLTLPRSSIKMLQALPLLESGAAEKFDLDAKMIALACASHRGEKDHLAVLAKWFEKVGQNESCLYCGPHFPSNEAAAHDLIRRGSKPTSIHNNCSGKHLGMVTTCLHLNESIQGYEKYEHNVQKRLRKVLTETMKVDHSKVVHATDGCGIPTYGVPLTAIAVGMSALINPKEATPRKLASQKILAAVKENPFYLSGSDNFTTAVIEKTQGRSIIKVGAEGVFAGVLPEKGMAFAVKAADGSARAAQVATAYLLLKLGGLSESEFKALSKYTEPTITNTRDEVVGQMRIAKLG